MYEALRHPCIVTFVGAVFVPGALSLVTEFCRYKSLESALKNYGDDIWTTKLKIKALYDCACALDYLHKFSIIHRDVKPSNLLVTSLEDTSVVCKLSDFGTTKGSNMLVTDVKMTKELGTPAYEAPEVLSGSETYTSKVDVYSFGIMMACVANKGRDPYAGVKVVNRWVLVGKVLGGTRPIVEKESEMPADFIKLMHQCWDADPDKRPPFGDIVKRLHT